MLASDQFNCNKVSNHCLLLVVRCDWLGTVLLLVWFVAVDCLLLMSTAEVGEITRSAALHVNWLAPMLRRGSEVRSAWTFFGRRQSCHGDKFAPPPL